MLLELTPDIYCVFRYSLCSADCIKTAKDWLQAFLSAGQLSIIFNV